MLSANETRRFWVFDGEQNFYFEPIEFHFEYGWKQVNRVATTELKYPYKHQAEFTEKFLIFLK